MLGVHPEDWGLSSWCRIFEVGLPPDCGVPGWPEAHTLWILTLGGIRAPYFSFWTQACSTSRPLLLKGSNSTLNTLKLPYLIPQQLSSNAPAETSPPTSHCHGNTFSTALLTSAQGFPHSFDPGPLLVNTLKSLPIPHMTKLKPLAWNQRPVQTIFYYPAHTSQMSCSLEESCVVSHLCACSPFLPIDALPT